MTDSASTHADDLALALRLAAAADEVSLARFQSLDLEVTTKPDRTPVTDADRAVEETIRAGLVAERPHDAIFGEEFTAAADRTEVAGRQWIIDTPGVRSFGLGHVDPANILTGFADLAAVAERCPRGCTHLPDSPDCALDEAVEAGELGEAGAARLDSLQRLLATLMRPKDY